MMLNLRTHYRLHYVADVTPSHIFYRLPKRFIDHYFKSEVYDLCANKMEVFRTALTVYPYET